MNRLTPALVAALLTLSCTAVASAQDNLRVGVRAGANWSLLTRPSDPAGQPTLNAGAAHTGWGLSGGVSAMLPIPSGARGAWIIALDVLVARSNLEGSLALGQEQRRTIELNTTVIQVPLHFGYSYQFGDIATRISVGPGLLMGIGSGATVTEVGTRGTPQALDTTPVTHFGLTAVLGLDYVLGAWVIPAELRFTYDPLVPSATRDRFDGYEDATEPGSFQVASDMQVVLMIGVDRLLGLDK